MNSSVLAARGLPDRCRKPDAIAEKRAERGGSEACEVCRKAGARAGAQPLLLQGRAPGSGLHRQMDLAQILADLVEDFGQGRVVRRVIIELVAIILDAHVRIIVLVASVTVPKVMV